MRFWIAVVSLALLGFGPQERPLRTDYPKDGVFWEPSWRDAYSECNNRETPMMVMFHKDGVESCESMASTLLADKKYIEASRMWVNVVIHPGTGHEVDVEIDRKRTAVCGRYWNIPCSAHDLCGQQFRSMFKDSVELPDEFPVIMFMDAQGKELNRVTGPVKVAELMETQRTILANYPGFKVPAGPWREGKAIQKEAEVLLGQGEWQKSIKTFLRLKENPLEGVRKLSVTGLDKIGQEGEKRFGEAYRLTLDVRDKKKLEEGKAKLREVVKLFKPLNAARKAEETLSALKSHGH